MEKNKVVFPAHFPEGGRQIQKTDNEKETQLVIMVPAQYYLAACNFVDLYSDKNFWMEITPFEVTE